MGSLSLAKELGLATPELFLLRVDKVFDEGVGALEAPQIDTRSMSESDQTETISTPKSKG